MGVLDIWDTAFGRIRANERLHLAWCCGGVIGCLVLYGVLQVPRGMVMVGWRGQQGRRSWRRKPCVPLLKWRQRLGRPRLPICRFAMPDVLARPAGAAACARPSAAANRHSVAAPPSCLLLRPLLPALCGPPCLQERIMQGSFGGETFTFSLFLVLCNRVTTMTVALSMLLVCGLLLLPGFPLPCSHLH